MSQRVVCIVQARISSDRLPAKVLRNIGGKPMIAHVLERAVQINGVNRLVLATSADRLDDALVEVVAGLDVPMWRDVFRYSPEDDVLARFARCALQYQADVVMRLTGDCPLLEPRVCEDVLMACLAGHEYAWNDTARSGYPDGLDCEAFTARLLYYANETCRFDDPEREHVTPLVRQLAKPRLVQASPTRWRFAHIKASVDTEDDLARVRKIYAEGWESVL